MRRYSQLSVSETSNLTTDQELKFSGVFIQDVFFNRIPHFVHLYEHNVPFLSGQNVKNENLMDMLPT